MNIDISEVKKLIKLLNSSNVAEIEIKEGNKTIRVAGHPKGASYSVPTPTVSTPQVATETTPKAEKEIETATPSGHQITSPMVGTYYESPSPDTPPFITVGQKVNVGDTLCIIEAMKMMNQIEADQAGTVKAILAENGLPVEFGQVLVIIE